MFRNIADQSAMAPGQSMPNSGVQGTGSNSLNLRLRGLKVPGSTSANHVPFLALFHLLYPLRTLPNDLWLEQGQRG
jgi:hypothetical protein